MEGPESPSISRPINDSPYGSDLGAWRLGCPLNDLLLMMHAAGSLSPVLNLILKATRLVYRAQAGALLVPDTELTRS
jgi:hypothetical protein